MCGVLRTSMQTSRPRRPFDYSSNDWKQSEQNKLTQNKVPASIQTALGKSMPIINQWSNIIHQSHVGNPACAQHFNQTNIQSLKTILLSIRHKLVLYSRRAGRHHVFADTLPRARYCDPIAGWIFKCHCFLGQFPTRFAKYRKVHLGKAWSCLSLLIKKTHFKKWELRRYSVKYLTHVPFGSLSGFFQELNKHIIECTW